MSVNMKGLLAAAQKNHFAIPAFNIGSDQLLKAVMKEAKESNLPVILEMSPNEFNLVRDARTQVMIYEVVQTDVPIYIHPDHRDSYETVVRTTCAGMTSIMVSTSTLPYEENAAVMREVVETAHIVNVSAESELRAIGTTGNSIEGGTQGVIYTVPEEARQFIEGTGIDTSAVVIGTAHGIYPKDMRLELRIDILKGIANKVDVPLALHGGPSNKDGEIVAATDNGICKINIPSDIKIVFYTQCRKALNGNPSCREPLEIYLEAVEIYGKAVEEKIRLFKSNGRVRYYY